MGVDTEKIAKLRMKLGISQADAGRRAGFTHRGLWSRVETGSDSNITIKRLEAIALVLGVPAGRLLK